MLTGIFEQTKVCTTASYSLEVIQDGNVHTLTSATLTLDLSSSEEDSHRDNIKGCIRRPEGETRSLGLV